MDDWLYPGQELPRLRHLRRAAANDLLQVRQVSSTLNSVRNGDPSVLEPEPALL